MQKNKPFYGIDSIKITLVVTKKGRKFIQKRRKLIHFESISPLHIHYCPDLGIHYYTEKRLSL
jgi:hypothetical protein